MKKELLGIVFLFLLILTSVSLISYSPEDPSLNNQSFSTVHVHNNFGLVGAHLSGLLIGLFGLSSFWIPVMIIMGGVLYFRGESGNIILMILAGGFLLILSTGAMMALVNDVFIIDGRAFSSGGFLGIGLASFLLKYVNSIGSVIVLVFFLFSGLVLVTGGSVTHLLTIFQKTFFSIILSIKTGLEKARAFIASIVQGWIEKRRIKKDESLLFFDDTGPEKKARINLRLPWQKKGSHNSGVSDNFGVSDLSGDNLAGDGLSMVNPAEDLIQKTGLIDKPEQLPNHMNPGRADFDGTGLSEELKKIGQGKPFVLPPVTLLNDPKKKKNTVNTEKLNEKAKILDKKLNDFGVSGEVVAILPGPVITTFEYRPAPGVKISKIVNLTDDLALALSALSIRIIAPIPGKDVIGVEIPNDKREMVVIKEMLTSPAFIESPVKLTLGLGKDIIGQPVAAQMNGMPHLLIAGATGTGKSVGLNTMIVSLLFKAAPDEVKFIMVDPKRIELSVYDGIPHLISPVVTDMKKATNALLWAVGEMERRYELLADNGVRNILQYNTLVDREEGSCGDEENRLEKMPYIVVIVDEFADLMMVASKEVEPALIRLAQMARAAGIHLILATQRPSVDVLTGVIKANFPTRISFQVSSRIDSRTILDANGSERLLGNGDMLFMPPGTGRLQRIQCAYISEEEIARVTGFLKSQQAPDYVEDVTEKLPDTSDNGADTEYDEKYDDAVAIVTRTRQASISSVQRHLRIGYNRAARIIEIMEKEGLIGPQEGSRPREVLVKAYEDD